MLKKLAGLGNLLQPGQFFLLFFPPMAYFNKTEILRKLAGLGETLASLLQPGQFFFSYSLANIAWQINIGSPRLTPLFICFKMINMDRCYEVI